MPKPRGIPEVPMQLIQKVGTGDSATFRETSQHRDFLVNLREQVVQLRQRTAVPDAPTNLKATAQGFQVLVQFSRSNDADYYEIVSSNTPNNQDVSAETHDVGNSQSWQDRVGQAGIKRYYWVRARKLTGAASLPVGPVTATTLAGATGVTPPLPPPPATIVIIDQATGQKIPYELAQERKLR